MVGTRGPTVGHEIDHRWNGEVLADHRSRLDDLALIGLEQVQASGEQRVDGGRHLERRDIADLHPFIPVAAKGPIVDEHREQLLHEERVPGRRLQDLTRDTGTQPVPPSRLRRLGRHRPR